jgi:hypothetical protein
MLSQVNIPANIYHLILSHAYSTENVSLLNNCTSLLFTCSLFLLGRDYWNAHRLLGGKMTRMSR